MSELRPYQVTAIDSALAALSNSGSAVLQMPTGAGKTRAATEIVKGAEGPVWFVCHRVEIAEQTAKAFKAAGIEFGMISPRAIDPDTDKPYPLEPNKRVQIITIGTLPRLLAELPAPSLVVWDECHHVAAKSWADIREMLTDAKHMGLTATPERLDGKGLSKWFAELVVGPTIESLITDEWLSPFRYFAPSDPDLSAAKMQAGDYNKKDLAKVMNTPVLIGDAVVEYRRVADGKRAIAFCASKEASRALVERFNAEGVPALHVDGDTHPAARREAVKALTAGDIKVLSNVEVFTEGFDVPGIEAVILMRPTKSPTLLLQMIGRALRFVEGKTAVIMDHAGLWQDHGSFAADWHWSLQGGAAKARRMAGVCGPRRCPKCSNVPFERVPVCANCGYEFPTGREIGEYDGVLTEVRTNDMVRVSVLARRRGFNKNTAYTFVSQGLPHKKVGGNYFTTPEEFANWISASGRSPHDKSKSKNTKSSTRGLVSVSAFCRKHNVSSAWFKKSAPDFIFSVDAASNGRRRLVLEADASVWISAFSTEKQKTIELSELCPSPDVRKNLLKHGLKYVTKGRCFPSDYEAALIDRQRRINKAQFVPPDGYANKTQFARLLGHKQRTTVRKLIKSGLQVTDDGFIHIQRGLEWVRDNTSIVIPPEAWPSANDNDAAGDSAQPKPPAAEAA